MNEAFEHYSSDRSRAREPASGAHHGLAGGAPCGDLVRVGLRLGAGRLRDLSVEAEGCASARAAAAATGELLDGASLAEAGLLDVERVAAELGGLGPLGRHGAELAVDAAHRALGAAALSGEPLLEPDPGRERVLVAISGGVDSAVAAQRERARGAEVYAVTLELWSDPANDGERSCCSPQAVRLARSVAHAIGIPHLTVDLRERFRGGVVEPFLAGHAAGRTPNPCIRCNGEVRLEPMIEIAERLGAACLVTGHYARLATDRDGPLLAAAADESKDQTYMLAALPPRLLAKIRFPLGGLRKSEVRDLAAAASIPVADRAESQDLCFLAGEGKRGFLRRHGGIREREGEIVDRVGRRVGRHRGHHDFTVGQRRGLGVAAAEPLYVLATDARSNRVVVGTAAELECSTVAVEGAVLHRDASRVDAVRLRYRSRPIGCALGSGGDGAVQVELEQPTRRPAPGQTAVFLDGDLIIGHGTIASSGGA